MNIDRLGEEGKPLGEEGGPVGQVVVVTFELEGQTFQSLDGRPEFTVTPAISFYVD